MDWILILIGWAIWIARKQTTKKGEEKARYQILDSGLFDALYPAASNWRMYRARLIPRLAASIANASRTDAGIYICISRIDSPWIGGRPGLLFIIAPPS